MKLFKIVALLSACAVLTSPTAQAQISPETAAILQKPVSIERSEEIVRIPLRSRMGKLALDAAINGVEREFIFDTGSPSMISQSLANELELELEIIGSNTGFDANGREFTTKIAVVDRMEIGGLTFRSVPVLIADFAIADPNSCVFDGGIIGSEIFPGSVWHFDASKREIIVADRFENLALQDQSAHTIQSKLYDAGYPHAPIFEYGIGEFTDRGLFDTGNSDAVTLYAPITNDGDVQSSFVRGSIQEGYGSHGVSAAGAGEFTALLRFDIDGVHLGGTQLGRLSGTTRSAPPSLLGLGILDTHSVTLDYVSGNFMLHKRAMPAEPRQSPGFSLVVTTEGARVSQLYKGSIAEAAGLKLGDQVTAIDNRAVMLGEATCETMRWINEARPAQSAQGLTVLRDGEMVEIELAK